jgi:hypothetical protein
VTKEQEQILKDVEEIILEHLTCSTKPSSIKNFAEDIAHDVVKYLGIIY